MFYRLLKRLTGAPKALHAAPRDTSDGPEGSEDTPELQSISNAVYALKAELTILRMEWAEVLDKMNAWSNRQAARDRVSIKRTLGVSSPADDDGAEIEREVRQAAEPGAENHGQRVSLGRHPKADLYNRSRR